MANTTPALDRAGFIAALGTYVDRALRAMREWRDSVTLPVAVNIPAGLVNSPDLGNMLHGALTIWGVEPSMLTVEVTEGAVIENKEAGFDNLQQLRELGCDIAQGYLYSRPLPEQELLAWLQQCEGRPRIAAG